MKTSLKLGTKLTRKRDRAQATITGIDTVRNALGTSIFVTVTYDENHPEVGGNQASGPVSWIRTHFWLMHTTPKLTPAAKMLRALKVIEMTPSISAWLMEHDPKAFEQVMDAIAAAEA